MADIFRCNLEEVERTAGQLSSVRDELDHFDDRGDAYAGALASGLIQSALDDFYKNSSDQRKKITDSVSALQKMLQGLADGVRDVDEALYKSLPDAPAKTSGTAA